MTHQQGANEDGLEANTQDVAASDLTGNPLADNVETSSSSGSLDSSIDLDTSTIDELNPNKIRRSMPLKTKSCDPAQCTDILDNMYEIYYDQEVSMHPFSPVSTLPTAHLSHHTPPYPPHPSPIHHHLRPNTPWIPTCTRRRT